ncbi:MAG: PEP-CTERM sorting domain-containing protein, partial [Planctomycetes bacterium]|nr:PEP-CTERM sorting domain-containing protein [Planctomycetota bacterium]
NFGGELGHTFRVIQPIEVTHLGAFDDLSDGFTSTITTRLWEATAYAAGPEPDDVFATAGNVLTSLSFDNTSGTAAGTGSAYVFQSLPASTVLMPGVYVISASGYNAIDLNGNGNLIATPVEDNTGTVVRFGANGFNAAAGSIPSGGDGYFSQTGVKYLGGSFEFNTLTPGIQIRNPSFEADALGDGGWQNPTTAWDDNWGTSPNAGIFNPPGEPATPPVPDGVNVAFLNPGGWHPQFLESPDGSPRSLGVGDTVSITVQAESTDGTVLEVGIRNPGNVNIAGGAQTQASGTNSYQTLTYDFTVTTGAAQPLLVFDNRAGVQIRIDDVSATYTRAALIQNPSFEIDPLADGAFTGTATDWSDQWPTNNDSGAYNPTSGPAVPDGSNVGFVNLNGWTAQSLENTDGSAFSLAAGDVISVTLEAASRCGLSGSLLDVDIRSPGNVSIVGGLQQQEVGASGFTTLTYLLTVDAAEFTPLLVLQNSTAADQLWFDNVSIARVVPEPSSFLLCTFGLLGLGLYGRRRRRMR